MNEEKTRQFILKSRAAGVPDEAILAYIEEKEAEAGVKTQQNTTPQYNSGVEDQGNFAANTVNSGKELVKGLASVVMNPIDTIKNLGGAAIGATDLAFGDGQGANADKARAVGNYYKGRYGGLGEAGNTLYTDPLGALADLSTVALGGVGAAKAGAGISRAGGATRAASGAERAAQTFGNISRYTDPISAAGRAIKATGATAKAKSVVTNIKAKPGQAVDAIKNATGVADENFENVVKRLDSKVKGTAEGLQQKYVSEYTNHFKNDKEYAHPFNIVSEEIANSIINRNRKPGDPHNLISIEEEVGSKIGQLVDKNKKRLDFSPARRELMAKLRTDANIQIVKGADGRRTAQILDTDLKTKLNSSEQKLMEVFAAELNNLGNNPTVSQLHGFKNNAQAIVNNVKNKNKILDTNAKYFNKLSGDIYQIIKNRLNDEVPGLKALDTEYEKYLAAIKKAESLGLLKETTQGNLARGASVVKSVAKSLHSGDARDFMKTLEEISGNPLLDKIAMVTRVGEDMGDYKVASLLENTMQGGEKSVRSGKIPGATDVIGAVTSYVGNKVADKVSGTPVERTTRYIKEVSVPDEIKNAATQARNVANDLKGKAKKADTKIKKVIGNTLGLRNLTQRSTVDKATRYTGN